MVNRRRRVLVWMALSLVLILALVGTGMILAQDSDEEEGIVDRVTPRPSQLAGQSEEDDPETGIGAQAFPEATMNYQGYVTDAGGSPLNGDYEMEFSLYDDPGAGTQEWGPETQTVTVTDGLFSVVLGQTTALDPYLDFDEQLYLEIELDGTTLPRQPLRAVPYAMGLVGGSTVVGPTGSDPALYVRNSSGDYGIYSVDVIETGRGFAGPDTIAWISLMNTQLAYFDSEDAGILVTALGGIQIERLDADESLITVYIPVELEQPYGRAYTIDSLTICYESYDGAGTDPYISQTVVRGRDTSTGAALTYAENTDNHGSTDYACYVVTMTDADQVSSTQAPTAIELAIEFPAVYDLLDLYTIRFRLDSTN